MTNAEISGHHANEEQKSDKLNVLCFIYLM